MLKHTLQFWFCTLLLIPAVSQAQAGRVLLAVGDVVVSRAGQELRLGAGAIVQSGDTIRIGPNSNAQLRMTDESVLALRERSELRIDEYFYSGAVDGREKSIFSLLVGGMRTITGVIGSLLDTDKYAVRTPTSTIGIRGTHYTLLQCNGGCVNRDGTRAPDGTYGGVTDGRIITAPLDAPALAKEFGHDEYFHVADRGSVPQSLIGPPSFLHDRLDGQSRTRGRQGSESSEALAQSGINAESRPSDVPAAPAPSEFVVTEQRTASGALAVGAAKATYGAMGSWRSADGRPGTGGAHITTAMLTISGTGAGQTVTGFDVPAGTPTSDSATGTTSSRVVGSFTGVTENQVDSSGEIFIGRWTGGSVTENVGTSTLPGGLHYVFGLLTPLDAVASKTGTVSFNGTALATTPTHSGGLTYNSGDYPTSISVNFTALTATVPAHSMTFGAQTWSMPAATATINASIAGAGFFIDGANVGSCTGGGCSGTLQTHVSAAFIGSAANINLGAAFGASNNLNETIQGVKVYSCSGC